MISTGCPTFRLCGCFVVIIPAFEPHDAVMILFWVLRSVSDVNDALSSWNLLSSITDALSCITKPLVGSAARDDPSGIEYLNLYIFSKSTLSSAFLINVVVGVSGAKASALVAIDVDKPLPVPTFKYHPPAVLSYCMGCPSSPGFLSSTFDMIESLPPKLFIPVIAFPLIAAFLLFASLT